MTLLCFTKKSEKVILQRQMLFEKLLNVRNAINVQITEHTVESTEFYYHIFFWNNLWKIILYKKLNRQFDASLS